MSPAADAEREPPGAAGALDALGDPNRRALLELLARGESTVGELASRLPISRPAVSRHLRLLRDAGLVEDHAAGTRRVYRLHDAGAEAVRVYLADLWGQAASRFSLFAENTTSADRPEPGRTP